MASHVQFPAIFKPRSGAGSHFVRRVDSEEELYATVKWTLQTLKDSRLKAYEWCTHEPTFMVEEFVTGFEVDVDCIVRDSQVSLSPVACPLQLTDTSAASLCGSSHSMTHYACTPAGALLQHRG